ncbi:hypothetical protein BpHYR1_001725 [Brachionus plicatilis]|uniref:Uncharacterized protein n=1 Tax=Brachionus plicatilis TaxID=10195 RepID=A0A3M7SYJ5_BRAPC|nr:hypothetical protein BpHYR1_001725 [Brachionus plicatilis]
MIVLSRKNLAESNVPVFAQLFSLGVQQRVEQALGFVLAALFAHDLRGPLVVDYFLLDQLTYQVIVYLKCLYYVYSVCLEPIQVSFIYVLITDKPYLNENLLGKQETII